SRPDALLARLHETAARQAGGRLGEAALPGHRDRRRLPLTGGRSLGPGAPRHCGERRAGLLDQHDAGVLAVAGDGHFLAGAKASHGPLAASLTVTRTNSMVNMSRMVRDSP